jgi:hypothetical protein
LIGEILGGIAGGCAAIFGALFSCCKDNDGDGCNCIGGCNCEGDFFLDCLRGCF